MTEALLHIDRLTVDAGGATARPIVQDVSIRIGEREVVGLVGESGSGKSTTARAVLRLLPPHARATGRVTYRGEDVLTMPPARLRQLRSGQVAMVFQDSRAALNPVRRVGDFLTEGLRRAGRVSRADAVERAVQLLDAVGLPQSERRLRQYPHELSGGMLQRVAIAAALAGQPDLLLADEATSALDVTTQAEVLGVLRRLQRQTGPGLLLITHDLSLAAAFCDRVYVMYAGRIAEERAGAELFDGARHPYARALLRSVPHLGAGSRLEPIPGQPPSLVTELPGCPFVDRCPLAHATCSTWTPELLPAGGGRTACWRTADTEATR